MKSVIHQLLSQALTTLNQQGILLYDGAIDIQITPTRDKQHGDFATNIALILAKAAKQKPRDIAQHICDALCASSHINKVEIAGPGFINFFMCHDTATLTIKDIIEQGHSYGTSAPNSKLKVQVEFVSANPTGPLHVGHGRGAAYGASLANLLTCAGYQVEKEYYVNDAGRQMDILAVSVWLRYLESMGFALPLPSNAYQGDYIKQISADLQHKVHDRLVVDKQHLLAHWQHTDTQVDAEEQIDALIAQAKTLLGDDYQILFNQGLDTITADIKEDLEEFNVTFDQWFSERSLATNHAIEQVIEQLQERGYLYKKEGALWFSSTQFGDDKDRVVMRDNGQVTYFASDIAYHKNKLDRGFDQAINVWGSDHHGYVTRVKAALQALGYDPQQLIVKLVQFATLYRGATRLQMSTRSGSFITLRTLRNEVSNDAARFFYITRKVEQHMDFDLDLAKSQNKDNPVYYIQYAHARICTLISKLPTDMPWNQALALQHLHLLVAKEEVDLIYRLHHYPDAIQQAATAYEPHQIAHYLRDLVSDFHTYYNAHRIKIEDEELRNARLALYQATRTVIASGLTILGVNAPQQM